MMQQNCLVTGGAGYIGSHFCKFAAQQGYTPIVLDNLFRGHKEFVKWGPYHEGNVCDGATLDIIFECYQPTAVFHFSGVTYVGESVTQPDLYYENNFVGTLSLLNAMRRHKCKNIVFSSTAATYGTPVHNAINEEHSQKPINPYGFSKYFSECLLQDYSNAYGINFAALRYFNACGADLDGEIGEWHTPETHLIPLIIDAALGKRNNISIFGTDYPTPDGTSIRDYIHVSDLASAHLKAMQYISNNQENLRLNLGTGRGYSVMQVIETVKKITQTDFPVINAPRREGDPAILVACSDQAKRLLEWEPIYSELEIIVKTAWQWHTFFSKTE